MGKGLIGALAGGFLGAAIWGGLAAATDMEFGIVAWALGGLVGGGAVLLGGRGKQLAVICGFIAALSIVGGKLATSFFVLDTTIEDVGREQLAANFTTSMHAELNDDAAAFAAIVGEQEYPNFMVERGFAEGFPVPPADLELFKAQWVPLLRSWSVGPKPFAEAKEEYIQVSLPNYVAEVRTEVTHMDVLKESFGLLDIVFFGLGIVTAYGMVARREEEMDMGAPPTYAPPMPGHAPPAPGGPRPPMPRRPPPPGQGPQPAQSHSPPPPPWESGSSNRE